MYEMISKPLVRRTRATFRSAEFGFFGVVVYTRVHTPRRCGLPLSAGVLVLLVFAWRPLRTSCWIVGIRASSLPLPPRRCLAGRGRICPGEAFVVVLGRVVRPPRS